MKITQTSHMLPDAAFRTHDLYLAAFLVAKGHRATLSGDARRRAFCFGSAADAEGDAYYSGAVIPALLFADAIRTLKTRLHS